MAARRSNRKSVTSKANGFAVRIYGSRVFTIGGKNG